MHITHYPDDAYYLIRGSGWESMRSCGRACHAVLGEGILGSVGHNHHAS